MFLNLLMEFNGLKHLSSVLEENIKLLENALRDTSKILYSEGNPSYAGITLLEELLKQWERVNDELEEANKKDEEDKNLKVEEIKSFQTHVYQLEKNQKEYESYLIQKNLLEPFPTQDVSNIYPYGTDPFTETSSTASVNSTFLTMQSTEHSTPDYRKMENGTNMHLENTMLELHYKKDSRKTFVVNKTK